MTSGRAASRGFSFANPTSAFVGHAVCDDPEWINGLSWPVSESYHPNAAGHRGYAGVVGPQIGSPVRVQAVPSQKVQLQAQALADQQRRYAEVDRAITPKTVVAPDLHSAEALAAAAAAGVDVDDPGSVAEADRRYEAAQLAARNG